MTRFIVEDDENTCKVSLEESLEDNGVYVCINDMGIMFISNEGYIELLAIYEDDDIGLEKETIKDEQFAVVYYPD